MQPRNTGVALPAGLADSLPSAALTRGDRGLGSTTAAQALPGRFWFLPRDAATAPAHSICT